MKQLYHHGGSAYLIYDRVLIEKFNIDSNLLDMNKVRAVRDFLGADHVLKDQTHFLFCEIIQDVEWEEVEPNTDDVVI